MATKTNKRLTRTIPPLRGPNSQVPPVKFSKGMTKGGLRIKRLRSGGPQDRGDEARGTGAYGDGSGGVDRSAVGPKSVYARNQSIKDVNKGPGFGGVLGTATNMVIGRMLDVPSMAFGAVKGIADKFSGITRSKTQTANQITDSYSRNNLNNSMNDGQGDNTVLCADGTKPPCKSAGMVNGGEIRVRGSRAAIRGTGFKGVF
jgi:hypothetical protein